MKILSLSYLSHRSSGAIYRLVPTLGLAATVNSPRLQVTARPKSAITQVSLALTKMFFDLMSR